MTPEVETLLNAFMAKCDVATAEQFSNQCQNLLNLLIYAERRFRERFPEEYAAYVALLENGQ
jgi:hypothetical protein